MPSTFISQCATLLAKKQLCVACAESATAGRLCSELALTPESGKILKGGLVCYDAVIKTTLLSISKAFIQQFTPESAEVTAALSERLATLIDADLHIAITGLATPGGSETPEKPVGTFFVDIWHRQQHHVSREVHNGTPEQMILAAVDSAARLIIEILH